MTPSPTSIQRVDVPGKSNASPLPNRLMGTVYLASPLATYATPRYDAMIATASGHFPHATILPARDAYHSNAEWRATWPLIRATLAGLLFFTDAAGWIGRGTHAEITDAMTDGVPVWWLCDDGALIPEGGFAADAVDPDDWRQCVHVVRTTPVAVQ